LGGFFLKRKDFYYWITFFKWAKLAKFIRYEAMWKLSLFFITKFTEMWWNDSVFEGSEEHRRCSGKVTDIRLAGVEKLFPWWKDSSLCYASFRMTGLCFLLTIRNLFQWENCFWIAKIFFIFFMFLREQSWRNSFEKKRGGICCWIMWWCDDAMMRWCDGGYGLENWDIRFITLFLLFST